jgi:hypothetical protein
MPLRSYHLKQGDKMTDFDLSAVDAQDEGELVIRHPKTLAPVGWTWTFYGPGHQITVDLSNRVAQAALRRAAARRQAQVNGKKWKEDEESLDQIRVENVDSIVTRTKGFSPIKLDGQLIEFRARDRCRYVRRRSLFARNGSRRRLGAIY